MCFKHIAQALKKNSYADSIHSIGLQVTRRSSFAFSFQFLGHERFLLSQIKKNHVYSERRGFSFFLSLSFIHGRRARSGKDEWEIKPKTNKNTIRRVWFFVKNFTHVNSKARSVTSCDEIFITSRCDVSTAATFRTFRITCIDLENHWRDPQA